MGLASILTVIDRGRPRDRFGPCTQEERQRYGKMLKRYWIALAVLAGFVLAPGRGEALGLGDMAPALEIGEFVKGAPVDLSQGKGSNIYVIEFWATWCGPCRTSIPRLSAMQAKYKDKGVVVVGISDENAERVRPYVEDMGESMEYTIAVDKNSATSRSYMGGFGVNGIPHAFVIDKGGRIVWSGHPMNGLEQIVDQLIAGKIDALSIQRAEKARALGGVYFYLNIELDEPELAEMVAERILGYVKDNAEPAAEIAMTILSEPLLKEKSISLAVRTARAAVKASGGADVEMLSLYAQALYESGDRQQAIDNQKRAVALAEDAGLKEQMQATLAQYENGDGRDQP